MKTIINVEIMAEDFPAEVEFHYSETDGRVVNVNKIELLADGYNSMNILSIYFISDKVRDAINEELNDKYRIGDYED